MGYCLVLSWEGISSGSIDHSSRKQRKQEWRTWDHHYVWSTRVPALGLEVVILQLEAGVHKAERIPATLNSQNLPRCLLTLEFHDQIAQSLCPGLLLTSSPVLSSAAHATCMHHCAWGHKVPRGRCLQGKGWRLLMIQMEKGACRVTVGRSYKINPEKAIPALPTRRLQRTLYLSPPFLHNSIGTVTKSWNVIIVFPWKLSII